MVKAKIGKGGDPKPLHIYLPPEIHEQLRKKAFEERRGMSTIVREIIIKDLKEKS